jgi:hypothetical protein
MNRRRGLAYLTVALGVGIVISGLACTALWLFRWQRVQDTTMPPAVVQTVSVRQWPAAEAKQALTATSACVRRFYSIDSTGFDQDVQGVLDCSAGELRNEVTENQKALQQALGDSTSNSAEVVDSAIVRFGDGRGTFLFSVDTTIRRPGSDAQAKHLRLIADGTLVNGRFLLTGLQYAN